MRVKWFRRHVSKFLSAYCHGELSGTEAQAVQRHLEDCARCREEWETIKRGVQWAEQLRSVAAPASLWPELQAKIAAPRSQNVSLFSWRYVLAATAVAVLALGSWWWLTRSQPMNRQVVGNEAPRQPAPSPSGATHLPTTTAPQGSEQAVGPKSKTSAPQVSSLAWEVDSVTGAPRIGATKIADKGRLGVGEWLETDNASRAKIKVAEIGYVDIDPNSRLQLVRTKETEHRIALAKGKMSALILAPPRLFIVDTPSATAVDLGCAYTLEVDELGASLLHVTSGWVSFVRKGQESFIPAGAMCATRKGVGVGTPYFADASPTFKAALTTLDFGVGAVAPQTLGSLLAEARLEDTLTLWHLLGRRFGSQTAEVRGRVYDRLAELAPPPETVTRAGIVHGDRKMLERWWGERLR